MQVTICRMVHSTMSMRQFFAKHIGDKAPFSLNGEVNTQNVWQYTPKGHPPAFNFGRNNSCAKLTVLAALCGNGIILGLAYLNMLNEFVFPQLAVHFGNQHWEDMFWGLWWGSRRGSSASLNRSKGSTELSVQA